MPVIPYELQPIGAVSKTWSIYDEVIVLRNINLVSPPPTPRPPKKPDILVGLGQCNHGVRFKAPKHAEALNKELTRGILPQYIAV